MRFCKTKTKVVLREAEAGRDMGRDGQCGLLLGMKMLGTLTGDSFLLRRNWF